MFGNHMPLLIYAKATSHCLENKVITRQCLSGGIYTFLPYFVNLLLLSLLSYYLFKMTLILPLHTSYRYVKNTLAYTFL